MDDEKSFKKPSLGSTAQAFNARFQIKKKLLEESVGQAEQDTKRRQALMLRIMTEARRSLMDVVKIDLGEQFEFTLDVDDWQGWPRVAVRVINIEEPHSEYPKFIITAHDRKQSATIEVFPGNRPPIAVRLIEAEAEARFPTTLRRAVRNYLDDVTEFVLKEEERSRSAVPEPVIHAQNINANPDDPLSKVDLFVDHEVEHDILEKLEVDENDSFMLTQPRNRKGS